MFTMRKISKIIVRDNHISFEYDCPDCPEDKEMITNAVKPSDKTNKEIKELLQKKFPDTKVE